MVVYCDLCKEYNKYFFPEDKAKYAVYHAETMVLNVLLCDTHLRVCQKFIKHFDKDFKVVSLGDDPLDPNKVEKPVEQFL